MTTSRRRVRTAFMLMACAALPTGCGGGTTTNTQLVVPQSRPAAGAPRLANAAGGNVSFTVGITPKKAPSRRDADYISPSTLSLKILTDGGNPVIVGLSPSSPNCTPNPNEPGSYICTASLTVASGNHVFTVTAYDAPEARGNVLSTNSTGPVYVKPVGPTMVSIVLEGVVAYVALSLQTSNPPTGARRTIALDAVVSDADGNLIVGAAPYDNPVTLTTTDGVNAPLSKVTLKSPADTTGLSVAYSGAVIAQVTFSATASGVAPANVTSVVLTPGVQYLYAANQNNSTVSVFDLANPSLAIAPIGGGRLGYPGGAAFDVSGKLYVANSNDYLSIFDTQNFNTPSTLNAISGDSGVAISASGILYTVNTHLQNNTVDVFDLVHNVALPSISGGDIANAWGVAIDATGKLYVTNIYTNSGISVAIFDTAHGNAMLPGISGLTEAYGAVVDPSGKLYVADYVGGPNAAGAVAIFDTKHGNAALTPIIGGGLANPQGGVALDAQGRLYVSNSNETISVFDTLHGNAPLPPLHGNALSFPSGLAVH